MIVGATVGICCPTAVCGDVIVVSSTVDVVDLGVDRKSELFVGLEEANVVELTVQFIFISVEKNTSHYTFAN